MKPSSGSLYGWYTQDAELLVSYSFAIMSKAVSVQKMGCAVGNVSINPSGSISKV
jgi:hypothetical protein